MILPLLYYDHANLRKKSRPIESITEEIKKLAHDMVETMVHDNGVGLAAPQVDQLCRLIVIRDEFVGDDGEYRLGPPEIFINPILSHPSKATEKMLEGCLSIPGIHAPVVRPASIRVRFQTIDGLVKDEEVIGFRARVIMHENDHLNGVLYIDRLDSEEYTKIKPLLQSIKDKYNQK